MNNDDSEQNNSQARISQGLSEAREAVSEVEHLIRVGFKDTDAKIRLLKSRIDPRTD